MTIDKRRLPVAPGQLPAFTPVPRQTTRHDGWTEERQRGFIEALADTGSVKAAAHRVNMTPEGAYLLRRHAQGQSFRQAWEAALALGVQRLEDIAMERAMYGQEVPVYSYGKLIGSRVVHNDRLLMFMLRNRAPTRFTADGRAAARRSSIGDPAHATELSRLKKRWRKEWEEQQAEDERQYSQSVGEDFIATLQQMHHRWFLALGPRARAAYRTFREAELAEQQERNSGAEAAIDLDMARNDLDQAQTEEDRAKAREAVAAAEQALARQRAEEAEAEADYTHWFHSDPRAKVWLGIDVMFGKVVEG